MEDDVGLETADHVGGFLVGDIEHLECHRTGACSAGLRQIGFGSAGQIVDDEDVIALVDEPVNKSRPDKTGPACYHCFHWFTASKGV